MEETIEEEKAVDEELGVAMEEITIVIQKFIATEGRPPKHITIGKEYLEESKDFDTEITEIGGIPTTVNKTDAFLRYSIR